VSSDGSKLNASLSELKRRKVFRVGMGYAVAAFALLQLLSSIGDAIGLAPGTLRLVILAILAGFPVALFLAWYYDIRPEGLVVTGGSVERGSPRWLELTIIGVLTVVVGGIGYLIYRPAAPDGERPTLADKSIAVLPFVDLSSDRSAEYFGDGLAEELLNVLAKVPDLRVAARTSSFAYKGRNEDVRRIGNELNVATVLEGSVRKSGDKVRVTVQLINVADGYHLWSENYDRTLDDVFQMQDEIAAAIAGALKVTLLGPTASAATAGTADIGAYDLYLLGRHNLKGRSEEGLLAAIGYFEKALAVDPRYARAWSGLADSYNLLIGYGNLTPGQALPKAEDAAQRALAIDDRLAEAHASLGLIRMGQTRPEDAEAEFKRALELDPGYAPTHVWYGTLLGNLAQAAEHAGQGERASALRAQRLAEWERAIALDPQLPPAVSNLAGAYSDLGRQREAIALNETLVRLQPANASAWQTKIAGALLALGAPVEALAALQRALDADPANSEAVAATAEAYLALGDLERAARWAGLAEQLDPRTDRTALTKAKVAAARRDPDAALAAFGPVLAGRELAAADPSLLVTRLAVALVFERRETKTLFAEAEPALLPFRARPETLTDGPWIALALQRTGRPALATAVIDATLAFVEARAAEGYQRGDWHYAAAQAHALAGRPTEALRELALALQRGWSAAWVARLDPTLASLRGAAAFEALLSTLDAASAAAREALSRSPPKDWSPPAQPPSAAPSDAELAGLAGNYLRGEQNQLTVITVSGAGLALRAGREAPSQLRAVGDDGFVEVGGSARLRFVRGADGRATHALVRWAGGEQRLKRIAWETPVAGSFDASKQRDYPGRYRFGPLGFDLTVTLQGERVMIAQNQQPPTPVIAERTDVYFIDGQALRLEFVRGADGAVTALRVHRVDDSFDGPRVAQP
jgi:TolB-like protein/tetratricopeptide (TPR) repeat protein